MSALTSLIRLTTTNACEAGSFIIAASDVDPFISHADALVATLEDSNPEKQHFRALVGLARATILIYDRKKVPSGFANGVGERLITLLRAYRYVFLTCK